MHGCHKSGPAEKQNSKEQNIPSSELDGVGGERLSLIYDHIRLGDGDIYRREHHRRAGGRLERVRVRWEEERRGDKHRSRALDHLLNHLLLNNLRRRRWLGLLLL